MNKKQFVVKHKDGWAVKKSNSLKATKVFETQKEAIEAGKEIAKNQGAELTIQGRDAKFKVKNSYGNDPIKVKG